MQKVLLVDDEFIILDGISSVIDWESLGTVLTGTAQNSVEALEMIEQNPPDIMITDIRMPGMDGLELVAKVSELYPQISFIVLTGFSEFNYAKTAMQYGVKHYLLKPCSEESLNEALAELVQEREEREQQENFIMSIKYGLERVMPHAKEQFLKEFVTNKTYGVKEWQYFGDLFGFSFQSQTVRLLLVEIEGAHEYEHLFAVRNIAEDIFQNPILSSTVGRRVLLLMEDGLTEPELFTRIDTIRETFMKYYHIDLTASLSEAGELSQARRLYTQTVECLNHRFYLGEGSLITEKDISAPDDGQEIELQMDQERMILLIKAGHWEDAEEELRALLLSLSELRCNIAKTKSYLIQIFMEIIRLCEQERMQVYMDKLPGVIETSTLQSFQQFVLDIAKEVTLERYARNRCKQSQMVITMKQLVQTRYRDETLTLQTIANEMYMNPDYVGKMFKKETGDRFTNYMMTYRIQKALERIEQEESCTITNLAEESGFGDNVSYFSKMFKKHTGFSPSEYKRTVV
ncbi:response regulator transcription factor [Paenibacillus donghaensis]|uniref:DNA-binding response regulator n=1 Tax=Paenibacillus donghaensis TaxID=414771 RepID=A0A2Z2KB67_9BACL|nr:response regulator [Paenibacillus donghaensis]ASA20123.1 DNA-binding response regulator [Paenibacillus donghaensis]